VVGFCGFLVIPSIHPEPQLVYALTERFTGRGYATEMASAAIAQARAQPGFHTLQASADEVNAASVRILRKLGFQQTGTQPGAFGLILTFTLDAPTS
jgi:ribosomal-protein-alanine N-acetyltransferase